MASRLTVVVSQAAGGSPASADLEESLVAQLMMTPGMDATMIGPLERVEMGGTDRLCLDSFNHSFAMVTWLPAEEVARHWERLELRGRIHQAGQPHPADTNRLFHFQLRSDATPEGVLAELKQILSDRNVKTVSIQSLGASRSAEASQSQKHASEPPARQVRQQSVQNSQAETSDSGSQSAKPHTSASNTTASDTDRAQDFDEEDAEWAHLDRLVDDFDSLDL